MAAAALTEASTNQRMTGSRIESTIADLHLRPGSSAPPILVSMVRDAMRNATKAQPAGISIARRHPSVDRSTSVSGIAIGEATAPQMVSLMILSIDRSGSRRTISDCVSE